MTMICRLRALGAPMFDAKTGKKYRQVRLEPGRMHTVGRSWGSCDVVFSDARVSRQHCQVYWDKLTNRIFLFEGAPNSSSSGEGAVNGEVKGSLNGVFVDGRKLVQGGGRVLNPGSEVSLAQNLDSEFGDAVGFRVEMVERRGLESCFGPLSPLDGNTCDRSESCRKRPLGNWKERPTDESLVTFEPRMPDLSEAGGGKESKRKLDMGDKIPRGRERNFDDIKPPGRNSSIVQERKKSKRSTAEIMALLRQETINVHTDVRKRENRISRGLERDFETIKLSGRICSTVTETETIERETNSTVIAGNSLATAEDRRRVSDAQVLTKAGFGSLRKKSKRSNTEIMGLLRPETLPVHTDVEKLEDKIPRGRDREFGNIQLSGRVSSVVQEVKTPLDFGRFGSHAVVRDTDIPVPVENSSATADDCSRVSDARILIERKTEITAPARNLLERVSDAQVLREKEVECLENSGGRISSPLTVQFKNQSCPRGGARELESAGKESISNSGVGLRNGDSSGSLFSLNRLKDPQVPSEHNVSLQELLDPTEDLLGIFAATFTCDILWFLSSHNIPRELPVTVARHDSEISWRKDDESRTCSPFEDWPNVNVVYPPFPDACCFKTEKRQGIGCHHPKIFLLPRRDSIRVIVSSANLTRSQWLHVTNSVWWQDFPRKEVSDYEALFCTSDVDESGGSSKGIQPDFAMHLSAFVASLVAGIPSAAHWALDLAKFDFSDAGASLVTSIPGLYGCPCPPVPRSVRDSVKNNFNFMEAMNGVRQCRKFLAAVNCNVVGIRHRFKDSTDPCGKRIRALAAILNNSGLQENGLLTVHLERMMKVAADPNAVGVVVSLDAIQNSMGMLVEKGCLEKVEDSLPSTPRGSVHIGFLPRTAAKWIAPLYDDGLCTFAACIHPNEVLDVASGLSKNVAQLVLYVFEGRSFSMLPSSDLSLRHTIAFCSLLQNMERPLGLWRLRQLLSKFDWPDSAETNFVFGSSSVGTSLDAAFFAAFSAAAGKKAVSLNSSEESDSQWGAWTAERETNAPSIGLVFPTIERVRTAKHGPFRHQAILNFAESTWGRLKKACVLHDAVPSPVEREGIPMHVKVAQRRFQKNSSEAPYGWIYCGSHNFSAAAWGRPLAKAVHSCRCRKTALACTLFISNYEVGLVFVEPPPNEGPKRKLTFKPLERKPDSGGKEMESDLKGNELGLDKFVLPFRVPAPKYTESDQPATKRAMWSAVESWKSTHLPAENVPCEEDTDEDTGSSGAEDDGDESQLCLDSEEHLQVEEEYGGILWSQIEPIMPQ